MLLTLAALAGVALGALLARREWNTPPEDTAADRRLRKEIDRHKGDTE